MNRLMISVLRYFIVIFSLIFLYFYNVEVKVSPSEQLIIEKFINKSEFLNFSNLGNQEQQILIQRILNASQQIISSSRVPPPHGIIRGITSSLTYGYGGSCYDRSYINEQILTYLDIPFRHVFISLGKSNSIFKYKLSSHALTELKTNSGWVLLESLYPHIYKRKSGETVSALDIANNPNDVIFPTYLEIDNELYSYLKNGDFKVWYGIYSRNGQFFPPYKIPFDINYKQLLYNF